MGASKRVTLKDVAEHAGVSSAVVSYVINGGPRHVAAATRERVMRAIEELGYRPNKFAQSLVKEPSTLANREIGIIIGGSSAVLLRPFYAAILAGIFDEVQQRERIRFMHFWEDLKDPLLFNEHIHTEEVGGLILMAVDLFRIDPHYQMMLDRIVERVPNIVCIDTAIPPFPLVTFDRLNAASTAVRHLIHLGHRRIAFVGNTGRRVTGYRQALNEAGIAPDERLIRHPGVFNSPEEGFQGTAELMALRHPPTAILAASDDVALGVLGAVQRENLKIPDDIALVGIDDNPLSSVVYPALTTMRVPKEQMGVHALRLLNVQREQGSQHGLSVVLDTELIIRDSCGARG